MEVSLKSIHSLGIELWRKIFAPTANGSSTIDALFREDPRVPRARFALIVKNHPVDRDM